MACGIRTADDFETILNNKTGIIKKFKGNEFKLYNEEYVNIKYQNSFNKLIFQKNNLYLVNVKNDLIFWQTNNKTKRGSYIIFQDDGNLVIYDENEKPNWATDTKSESIKEIQFLYDSIEFYNSNEVVVDKLNVNKSEKFLITKNEEFKYNSGKISIIKEELFNNLTLNQGEFIECGMAKLIFDTKGRLLLYHNDTLVWFTKMINGHHKDDESQNGYGGKNAKFQDDGNLVIYSDDGKPTWCSKEIVKDTHIKHYLKLSSDGNLSIIDYKSNKIWSATHFKIGIAQKQYINYTARPNILSMLYDMYPNNVLEHYIPNLVDKSSFHEKMCAMPINSIYLHSSTEAIFNNNDELMHYNLSENKIVNKHDKKTAKAGDGYTPKIFKNDKIEYTDEL